METIQIADKKFYQDALKLGQLKELSELAIDLKISEIDFRNLDIADVIQKIGNNAAKFCAIILTPEGVKLHERNKQEIEEFLNWNMDIKQIAQVVRDFFEVNGFRESIANFQSKLESWTANIEKLTGQMDKITKPASKKQPK